MFYCCAFTHITDKEKKKAKKMHTPRPPADAHMHSSIPQTLYRRKRIVKKRKRKKAATIRVAHSREGEGETHIIV